MAQIKGGFTLVLETENLAAWMPIVNTFAWDPNDPTGDLYRYWNGILFQLGNYKRWKPPNQPVEYMIGFDRIELYRQGELIKDETIRPDAFDDEKHPTWINIVARAEGSKLKEPMLPKHLADLKIAPPKSLDHYLKPYAGGVTLWSEKGYAVVVVVSEKHAPGKQYTFTTNSNQTYEVKISLKGEPHPVQEIDTLKICEPKMVRLQQGSHVSPPQQP